MGTAAVAMVLGSSAVQVMAIAIMVSTFGCMNGMILAGARVYYAMARDGLFFRRVAAHRPASGTRRPFRSACSVSGPAADPQRHL